MTTRKIYHMSIDVRGVLGWKDKDLKKLFDSKDANEIRKYLCESLDDGHRVLPFGNPCEGWCKKEGCPGHPEGYKKDD